MDRNQICTCSVTWYGNFLKDSCVCNLKEKSAITFKQWCKYFENKDLEFFEYKAIHRNHFCWKNNNTISFHLEPLGMLVTKFSNSDT
jgi:hypothetical protein